ncbi:MAG: methylenetetrahydrofolate--tRNA-(uracil(54)-C(5))-methyltransferase (FADH(2)-oxidizing) TrmFO [Clostridia bacterium]|nr:methylenetetrahydrofolate--tRNA-(uracil(54)-C(5))-methyltransferase (FADH(2)-oxidizing) TrmFO [Clostridia bacterium]
MEITVIGAGLAGCEAAWQAAQNGADVTLCEMKPRKFSTAHHSAGFAELVCSNSLRAERLETAAGLLKEEMRRLGSLIIACADESRVPAGGALAVDRDAFSGLVTQKIRSHARIRVIEGEIEELPREGLRIAATGPLTSEALSQSIARVCAAACHDIGEPQLHFYDAAAPVVERASIDMEKAYFAARYGRGGDDYINCPLTREEYEAFLHELLHAGMAELHGFDEQRPQVFEGCMPVEVMAARGHDTLLFGPLRPVGLRDPRTGAEPFAVVQLRQDDAAASLYNLVGFQTHLKFPEQRRVFSMIPALANAQFARYGVMHRNTYLNSPALLDCFYRLRAEPSLYFAGQITGVEGYIESASSGLLAGLNCARQARGLKPIDFTASTACGALAHYISSPQLRGFQPMNINFGLIAPPVTHEKIRGRRQKYELTARNALEALDAAARDSQFFD